MGYFVDDVAATGPSSASAAYSGAPITVGAPTFGAPAQSAAASIIREVIIGVVVASLVALLLRGKG